MNIYTSTPFLIVTGLVLFLLFLQIKSCIKLRRRKIQEEVIKNLISLAEQSRQEVKLNDNVIHQADALLKHYILTKDLIVLIELSVHYTYLIRKFKEECLKHLESKRFSIEILLDNCNNAGLDRFHENFYLHIYNIFNNHYYNSFKAMIFLDVLEQNIKSMQIYLDGILNYYFEDNSKDINSKISIFYDQFDELQKLDAVAISGLNVKPIADLLENLKIKASKRLEELSKHEDMERNYYRILEKYIARFGVINVSNECVNKIHVGAKG